MPYDEETGEKIPLAAIKQLPDIDGHHLVIAEIPMENNGFKWTEYLAVCSCGSNLAPPRGRYHTKRGATERGNTHLRAMGKDTEIDLAAFDADFDVEDYRDWSEDQVVAEVEEEWDPFA